MKRFAVALIASAVLASSASADIFVGGGGFAFVDNTTQSGTLAVGSSGPIVSFNSITIDVTTAHTWVGDIALTLTAPNGDNVHLMRRLGATTATGVGSSGDWLVGAHVFVDGTGATLPLTGPVAAGTWNRESISGNVTPAFDPDTFAVFAGDEVNGVWTLSGFDGAGGDVGVIGAWSMDITLNAIPEPGSAVALLGLAGLGLIRRRVRG